MTKNKNNARWYVFGSVIIFTIMILSLNFNSAEEVECTTNAGCSNGQICDLSTMNYGKCITTHAEDYCGDGSCGLNENIELCAKDCDTNYNPSRSDSNLNTTVIGSIILVGFILLGLIIRRRKK